LAGTLARLLSLPVRPSSPSCPSCVLPLARLAVPHALRLTPPTLSHDLPSRESFPSRVLPLARLAVRPPCLFARPDPSSVPVLLGPSQFFLRTAPRTSLLLHRPLVPSLPRRPKCLRLARTWAHGSLSRPLAHHVYRFVFVLTVSSPAREICTRRSDLPWHAHER